MRAVIFGFFVLVLAVAFHAADQDPVAAQGKKEIKKAAAGVIEIGEGKDGKFRFFVRDSEGKLLAMSGPGGFETTKDAQAAIDNLKEVIGSAKVATVKKDKKDKEKN